METLLLILKIALAVGCAVGIYYLFIYVVGFWYIIEGVCLILQTITKVLLYPFKELYKRISKKFYSNSALDRGLTSVNRRVENGLISRFADRHPLCGTAKSIRFVLVSLVFIAAVMTVSIATGNSKIVEESIYMFPFFFIVQLLSRSVVFSFAGLLAVGFSAMMISAFFKFCMGEYEREGSFIRWLISVIYYVITTVVSCFLGYLLSGVWEWVVNKGVSLFVFIKTAISTSNDTLIAPIKIVGCAVALLLLIYIAVILISIALKEYFETFCYGGMGVLLFAVVTVLCLIFGGSEFINTGAGKTILIVTFLLGIFGFDFIRVSKEEILEIYKEHKHYKKSFSSNFTGSDD